jgi:hypothetical protein
MTDDKIVDVYSRPDVYPQYNEGRLTNTVKLYFKAWEEADKSGYSPEQIAYVEEKIANVEAQLQETIVDTAKWKEAEGELRLALVSVGAIEDTSPTAFDRTATSAMQNINNGINFLYMFTSAK